MIPIYFEQKTLVGVHCTRR